MYRNVPDAQNHRREEHDGDPPLLRLLIAILEQEVPPIQEKP
jgi:hypothetical protein